MGRLRSGFLEPRSVLREALNAPNHADLLVEWFISVDGSTVVFTFGNGDGVDMPLAWLPEKVAQQVRDGTDPELIDYGQAVRFGTYEVAWRAITSAFYRHDRCKQRLEIARGHSKEESSC